MYHSFYQTSQLSQSESIIKIIVLDTLELLLIKKKNLFPPYFLEFPKPRKSSLSLNSCLTAKTSGSEERCINSVALG